MFDRFTKKDHQLDPAISKVLTELEVHSPEDPDYQTNLSNLERLYKLKDDNRRKFAVSPDALVNAGAMILTTVIIVGYERTNVMTSTATNFLKKP